MNNIGNLESSQIASNLVFSFTTGQWTLMDALMNVPRENHGVVTFESKVYVYGGYKNESDDENSDNDNMDNDDEEKSWWSKTIEIFDPKVGSWTMAGEMRRHEGEVGVAALPINCSKW